MYYYSGGIMSTEKEINKMIRQLDNAIEIYGINSKEVETISKKIDESISELKQQKKNIMQDKFKECIEELKKIKKNLKRFPDTDEWNTYAKEKSLLNSLSIKYISGLTWDELRKNIKRM